ncbi:MULTISPECIES: phage baseplate assembly protein V [unclassified Variovorax]|uniref:phage baseplate assembly protein V n=1 Tax=unclassified Variovorax TaxID=663243 RepID=UPI003ED09721
MSAALLYDSMARIARHEATARPVASVGVVTSQFAHSGTADHAVSVQLRDSGVVLPRVPVAVGAMGFAAIPAIDDLVLVAFLEGDWQAPVVVGRLYHPDQQPPKHKDGELVLHLPSGAAEPELACKINVDPVKFSLSLPGDVLIEVEKDKLSLAVGKLSVLLEGAGGGRLTAAAGETSMTMKADGDMTFKSAGKIKLDGSEIEIAGSAKVKISAGMVEIN